MRSQYLGLISPLSKVGAGDCRYNVFAAKGSYNDESISSTSVASRQVSGGSDAPRLFCLRIGTNSAQSSRDSYLTGEQAKARTSRMQIPDRLFIGTSLSGA